MDEKTVLKSAYAMPLSCPDYVSGPVRFRDRETFTITYESDLDAVRRAVPAPLDVERPLVKFEVVHMPNSSGLGGYFESGQVIPVKYKGGTGNLTHMMFLDNAAGVAAGRERFGFPKKWGHPRLEIQEDSLVGTLDYGATRVATATMGFKHRPVDFDSVQRGMSAPNFLLKIIPHIDDTLRVCELVTFGIRDITVKEAWSGPAALSYVPHALAPLAELPVRKIVSASHTIVDMSIVSGEVIHDYLG